MRKVAAESIVLLKNEGNLLPLDASKLKKVAIVGGSAKAFVLSGGGSASLKPSYFVSPYDGITSALGNNVEVTYTEGARSEFYLLGRELYAKCISDGIFFSIQDSSVTGQRLGHCGGGEGLDRHLV